MRLRPDESIVGGALSRVSGDALKPPPWLSALLRPASHSDLFLLPDTVRFSAGPDWIAVICNDRPDFVYGNYLILRGAPSPLGLRGYADVCSSFFRNRGVRNVVLQWEEGPEGVGLDVDGWTLDRSVVLERTHAMRVDAGTGAKRVSLRAEGDRVLALLEEGLSADSTCTAFLRWRLGEYARLVESGRGEWLAVWEGDRIVATCGVFRCGGVTRVQELVTAPCARRRGHATALCQVAFGLSSVDRAIAVAEPGGSAEQLYRSLGFETAGWQFALLRRAS